LVSRLWSLSSVLAGRWAAKVYFAKHSAYREIPSAGAEVISMQFFYIKILMKVSRAENTKKATNTNIFYFYFQEIPVSIPLVIFGPTGVKGSRQ